MCARMLVQSRLVEHCLVRDVSLSFPFDIKHSNKGECMAGLHDQDFCQTN